jgi:hypothetical protein
MRRSGCVLALTAVFLAVWPASILGQSEPPIDSGPGELGGRLLVDVPQGAVPSGTTITVVTRDPSERPEELRVVPMRFPFYELQPTDVRFSAPVTVTRWIGFQELDIDGFDPLFDGLVVASLLSRDPAGTWAWLGGTETRLDLAEDAVSVTATTDHGGPIIASVAGDLLVATDDDAATPVGGTFRVEGQLRVDPASRADIVGVSGRTSDETIATAGQGYDVEAFDRAEGLEYQCLAPGTVTYESTFSTGDVGDVGPVADAIGLPGTVVAVTHTGEHTCE